MFFRRTILLLFGFLCYEVSGQDLSGQLIHQGTGRPLQGVLVEIPGDSTRTDFQGRFLLKPVQFPVLLRITAAGFKEFEKLVYPSEAELNILLQPLPQTLPEVVLQSTRIPQKLLHTPAAVSILDRQDLERTDATSLVSTIAQAPGVFVHQGALNTNKLSIRGIGSRSQYSTNRVKAFFMGIPLTSAEGETTLDDLAPETIERVEIVKGPASSLYGAGLGGAISLVPAEAQDNSVGNELLVGSFGLVKNTLQASYQEGSSNLSATYQHLEQEGYRENSEYNRNAVTLNGGWNANKKDTFYVLAQLISLKAYIPSSLDQATFENHPSSAAPAWRASRGYEAYDKALLGLVWEHEVKDLFTSTTSTYVRFKKSDEPRPFDILREEQMATGARARVNLDFFLWETPAEVSVGGDIHREWYDLATFANLYEEHPGQGSQPGIIQSHNSQDRGYMNVFAQWNTTFSEEWWLEAGINLNATWYRLEDLFYQDAVDQSGRYRFQNVWSPRVGLVHALQTNKNLYVSISHGFSTPGVTQTLTPEGLINTQLRPETGINYELGLKGHFLDNQLYAEAALFSVQVENLLVAERVGPDRYVGKNAGKTDHTGVEFMLKYRVPLASWLELNSDLRATVNRFRFDKFVDGEQDFSGNALPAVPDKSLQVSLDLSTSQGFTVEASFQHEGEMPLNDQNSAYTESYNLIHLKAAFSKAISDNFEVKLSAGINNVSDTHYAASIIPNAVGFSGSAPRYYYPGLPRRFFSALKLKYRF